MFDTNETIIGHILVAIDGVDMGLTTDDGMTFKVDGEVVDLTAAQSIGVLDSRRTMINVTAEVTFLQLSFAKWRIFHDLNDPGNSTSLLRGRYQSKVTRRTLTLTMPGPNGTTRTFVATIGIKTPGELVFNNKEYTGAAVEMQLYCDPTTNEYYTIAEAAGSNDAPTLVSTQHVVGSTETTFSDGGTNVPVAAIIQATFNVAIRPDMLSTRYFSILEVGANTPVAATVTYGITSAAADYTEVRIDPTSNLAASTTYNLIIGEGVLSNDGVPSASMIARQFTTA